MNIQHFSAIFAVALAASVQTTMAMGMPPAIDNGDVSTILGIKPGSTARSAAMIDLEALQAVSSDSLIGNQAGKVLHNIKPEYVVRGAKEAQLYKRYSRTVVLVVTKDGLGTGSLINSDGDILTNWHVVRGFYEVGVVFKPAQEGMELKETDVRRAKVIKIDEVSDLALIHVEKVPAGINPISLGDLADIAVGSDVHAIGHPTGEAWTYTRGVVSQIRKNYEWSSRDSQKAHRAHVIQTQTPINPGNSGGPLLTDDGKLVGVNSFKSQGEGLNFAIAVDEVKVPVTGWLRMQRHRGKRLPRTTPSAR